MKSMAMGTGMARMRSERKMAAPLSTPTRSGLRPAYSRPMARPSSPIRAAISARAIRTRPGRSGIRASVGGDEGRDRHPGADALGQPQRLVAGPRADHANAVAGAAVLRGHRALGNREARRLELLLDPVSLLPAAEGAHLHAPARGRGGRVGGRPPPGRGGRGWRGWPPGGG